MGNQITVLGTYSKPTQAGEMFGVWAQTWVDVGGRKVAVDIDLTPGMKWAEHRGAAKVARDMFDRFMLDGQGVELLLLHTDDRSCVR